MYAPRQPWMKRSETPGRHKRGERTGTAPGPTPPLQKSKQEDKHANAGHNKDNGSSKASAVPVRVGGASLASSSQPALKIRIPKGSSVSVPAAIAAIPPVGLPAAARAAAKTPYHPASTKGGPRIRLPDKLMEYLNNQVEPAILWWQDREGFAFDSTRVQTEFLDKYFEKTKLKSFIRSLNRWGFRRIFYHTLPKKVLTFSHPLFKKNAPELAREMRMVSYSGQQQAEMEEYNRHQKEGAVAAESKRPAAPEPVVQPLATQADLSRNTTGSLMHPTNATLPSPQSPLQHATNPLGGLPSKMDSQHLQLFQQQQLQQQLAQQLDQQTFAQSLLLQSMLNVAQYQQPQQSAIQFQQQTMQQMNLQQLQQQQQIQHMDPATGQLVHSFLAQQQSQQGLSNTSQQQQQSALAQVMSFQHRMGRQQQQHLTIECKEDSEEAKKPASSSSADTLEGDKPPSQPRHQ